MGPAAGDRVFSAPLAKPLDRTNKISMMGASIFHNVLAKNRDAIFVVCSYIAQLGIAPPEAILKQSGHISKILKAPFASLVFLGPSRQLLFSLPLCRWKLLILPRLLALLASLFMYCPRKRWRW